MRPHPRGIDNINCVDSELFTLALNLLPLYLGETQTRLLFQRLVKVGSR